MYNRQLAEYQAYRETVGEETYATAHRPTNYNTGGAGPSSTREASMYYAGRREVTTNATGGTKETYKPVAYRLQNQQKYAREAPTQQPGIYRAGNRVTVTSLGDGVFASNRGPVEVRRPIASGIDGKPVYAARSSRFVSGIDLFNPENRRAIAENSGQFATVGAMFKSAENNPSQNGSRTASVLDSGNNLSSRDFDIRLRSYSQKPGSMAQEAQGFSQRVEGTRKREQNLERFNQAVVRPVSSRIGSVIAYSNPASAPFAISGLITGKKYFPSETTKLLGQKAAESPFHYATFPINTGEKIAAVAESLYRGPNISKIQYTGNFDVRNPEGASNAILTAGSFYLMARSPTGKNTPSSITQNKNVYVSDSFRTSPGSVAGSGQLQGTVTAVYRRGPFGLFKKTEVVPSEGSYVFSGNNAMRGNALVNVDAVNSVTLRGKTYYSDTSFSGTFNLRSSRLFLQDQGKTTAYISQPGRGTIVGTDVRTSPGNFAVFERNKYGQYQVTTTGKSRGVVDNFVYNKVRVTRPQSFVGDGFSGEITSVVTPPQRVAFAGSVRTSRSVVSGGAPFKMSRAGFNDARIAGFYTDPPIVRPFGSRAKEYAGTFARDRRGQSQVFSNLESPRVIQQPRYRAPSSRFSSAIKNPVLDGLPVSRYAVRSSSRQVLVFAPQSQFAPASKEKYGVSSGLGFGARASSVQSQRPVFDLVPSVSSRFDAKSDALPKQSSLPRYDLTPRLQTISGSGPRSPVIPAFDPIPPPSLPPGVPPFFPTPTFGGPSGGGDSRGSRRLYGYAPSFGAVVFNVRGNTSQQVFSGFELRPLRSSRRRKR